MKQLRNLLAFSLTTVVLLISSVQPVAALGGWVDHKFELERPDGTRTDLKGAKMHVYHRTTEGGFKNVNSFCAYPDKDPNIAKYVDEDNEADEITLSGGYHCLTPQSCTNSDFGAPYLPKSFNSAESIYYTGNGDDAADSSYRAFHETNFTSALPGFFGTNAPTYREGNIRGFDNTKWQISIDWTNGSGVTKATQTEIDQLEKDENAWGNIPGISGRQEWSEGEVYRDPAGENALHARITWILKPPVPAPVVKPTGSLAGRCATTSPGVPSYTYTLSNIDLKGLEFADTHLYLKIPKGSWTEEIKTQFGPPLYESSTTTDYSLIFNTTVKPDANKTITLTVLPTEGIGNTPQNTKTVADFVKWVDGKRAAGAILPPFEIASTLNAQGNILNDYIGTGSTGFKPKFVTNECGQPTGGGTIPACVSLTLLDGDNKQIINMGALLPGASMKILCGPVTGATKYAFRYMSYDAQGVQIGEPVNLSPDSVTPNRSQSFNIPNAGGRFTAQCAICENGTNNCQFDIPNYNPPAPVPNTQCVSPNSCVSSGGCTTPAASGQCAVNNEVCCANRTRDETPVPATPTPVPTSTACVTPNSCVTSSGCMAGATVAGKTCSTAGQVCCSNRTRDETPVPATPTPVPTSTACVSPNSCTTSAGCLTLAAGKTCTTSGQVCCAVRTRDE